MAKKYQRPPREPSCGFSILDTMEKAVAFKNEVFYVQK